MLVTRKVCWWHFSARWWHSNGSPTSLYARMWCWRLTLDVGDVTSPTSQTCHQHIWSPTSVTNIGVTFSESDIDFEASQPWTCVDVCPTLICINLREVKMVDKYLQVSWSVWCIEAVSNSRPKLVFQVAKTYLYRLVLFPVDFCLTSGELPVDF